MKDISEKLLAVFLVEQREHISRLRALLGPAEAEPLPLAEAEANELLRRAHTLKGAARAVGMAAVETLAHRMEAVLARARDGALELGRDGRALLHRALDAAADSVAAELEHVDAVDTAGILAELEALAAQASPPARAPGPAPPAAAPSPPHTQRFETLRIEAKDLEGLAVCSTQLLAETQGQAQIGAELRNLCRRLRELELSGERATEVQAVKGGLAAAARQARSLQRAQQGRAWALGRLVDQLEQYTSRLRMVPAESVFDGFGKMVRDLAQGEGKAVEFRAQGLDTRADRLLLQALRDPVMHLLRNAITHGIEPAGERAAAGKPAAGRISLRVEARGDQLLLTVDDDGRGIDVPGLAQAAVRRGLLSEPDAAARPAGELARLAFQPGVSTAASVSRLAGRGMGLSVVQEAVKGLQGEIALRHASGQGTSVLLALPLAISRHHLVLAACAGQVFGIPSRSVERLYRAKPADFQSIEGRQTLRMGSQAVPVATLAQLLDLPEAQPKAPAHVPVVLLRSGEERLAVIVDALLDERNAAVMDLGLEAAHAGRTAGGVVLEDGRVALIANPGDLWEAFRRGVQDRVVPVPVRPEKRPSILVVDDSITTRSLEKSILAAQGYDVRLAVDGVDALEQLRAALADLVITDILMPRLDGFGLLERMKADTRLERIPVVIVSSVEDPAEQQRGLSLGADAYVVKRKFDQRALLEAVRQLL